MDGEYDFQAVIFNLDEAKLCFHPVKMEIYEIIYDRIVIKLENRFLSFRSASAILKPPFLFADEVPALKNIFYPPRRRF